MINRFLTALQFLSVIPISGRTETDPRELGRSMGYFPMVGLLLGLILAFSNELLSDILPNTVTDGILMIILIVFSGALHLDGLADTVDGLAGGNTREEALHIMRDSRVGAIGVVGLIMTLLLKYVSLVNIPDEVMNKILIAMPMISRYSMVQLSFFSDYARPDAGIGQPFTRYVGNREFISAAVTTFILSLMLLGMKGIILVIIIGTATLGLVGFFRKTFGGVTGDTFGATNEINEVLILIVMVVLVGNG